MTWETFDLYSFSGGGHLLTLIFIGASLLVVQAVFSFLLWRKGESKYFLRFLIYVIGAVAVFAGAIGILQWVMETIGPGGSYDIWIISLNLIATIGAVAVGIMVYLFIRDLWLHKEE
ncbi:MAG: hypothetical protein ACTSQQ_17765, partial [Candidatus Helarchaeota archaeon]